jgi:uncharacterized protein (TIGR03437 family)
VVTGAYKIGGIPPNLQVFLDQSIDFVITSPVPNATLRADFNPAPAGTVAFVANTGSFKYTPSRQDPATIAVTFTATSAAAPSVSQTIFLNPIQLLRPDQDFMQNRRPPPDESTGVYTKYIETQLPNGTRACEVSGRTITLQAGDKIFSLVNWTPPSAGAPANGDVTDLKIYAETLVIRSPLLLPRANVTIYARELRFEDAPNTTGVRAKIDTTPQGFAATDIPQTVGASGAAGTDGGGITLYIQKLTSVPDSAALPGVKRLVMTGASGQGPGPGKAGGKGPSYDNVPNPFPQGSRDFPYKCGVFNLFDCTDTCRWPTNGATNTIFVDISCLGHYATLAGPAGGWPGNGGDSTAPGRPGRGGNGGNLVAKIEQMPAGGAAALTAYVSQAGGAPGATATTILGGAAGTPTYANRLHFSSSTYFEYTPTPTRAGANGVALGAPTSSAAGTATVTSDTQSLWLHPSAVSAVVSYMKDAYRDGNLELARSIAADYRPFVQKLAAATNTTNPDWPNLFGEANLEIEQMLARLDYNLDYYGNRAGWTPLLSLQANMTLLNQEVNSAVSMLYLATWMDNYYNDAKKNLDAMNASKAALWQDIQAAQKTYADAVNSIPDLQTQAADIQTRITVDQTSITQLDQRLTALAQDNVALRNQVPVWKTGVRLLATACQLVPVYQPALGAIGSGLNLISNIDTNKPLDTYQQGMDLAKQFNDQLFSDSNAQLKAQLAKLDPNGQSASDYAKNVIAVYNQYAGALENIRKSMQQNSAPQGDIDAELKKLEAQDPQFAALSDEIIQLNAKKAALAKAISDTTDAMTKASQTISANLVTISEVDRTLRKTIQTMDMQTLTAVRDMGRRAQERLQKYLYYMAKSYEYAVLQPYPGDLRLDAVQSQIQNMLGSAFTTDPAKFSLILEPYRQAIRQVIQAGVDQANSKPRTQKLPITFDLTSDELQTLNTTNRLAIDLTSRIVGLGWEEKRIVDLRVDDSGIAVNPSNSPAQILLGLNITGDSVLTTTYAIGTSKAYAYAFRFGSAANPDPFSWTDSYLPSQSRLQHSQPDTGYLSLLKTFLTGSSTTALPFNDSDLAGFIFAQPAAEAQLVITRSPSVVRITSLRLNALVSYVQSGTGYGVVSVMPASSGAPPVSADTPDLTMRSTGAGAFRRVYRQSARVTFTVDTPPTMPKFLRWVDGAGATISTSPSVTLPVALATTIQPIFDTPQTGACTYSLTANGNTFAATAGSGSVDVKAGPGCPWTAVSNAGWVKIPSASASGVGPATVLFTLDLNSTTGNRTGTLTIAGQTYTVTQLAPSAGGTVTVTPSTLPAATTGAAYSQTFTGSGGTAPYSFSIAAGTLPAGIALSASGVLSGVAVAPGTYQFTVTATDARNLSGSAAVTLTVVFGTVNPPVITAVVCSSLLTSANLAPNTYVTIRGSNLYTGSTPRAWTGADFNGNKPPTSLDGTSVTVNGKPAYVFYVSAEQVNIITPPDQALGAGIPVVVTVNGIASAPASITTQALAPSFFMYFPGGADDLKYAVAQHNPSGDLVGRQGLFPTAPNLTSPAKPGEVITLWGTGFGPTTPSAPSGVITDTNALYKVPATATLGGIPCSITVYLAPSLYQIYQASLTIPSGAPSGDNTLLVTVNGVGSPPVKITVQ